MRLRPTIPAPTHVYSQAQTPQLDAQQGQFLQDPSGQPRKTDAQTPVYQAPAGLTRREDTALHAPSTGIWGVNQVRRWINDILL
ncbi:hypothetical protein FRC09_000483 [Ceratobasidium sp. 395]|nr:hypothetical protein FRC09_000483 [Ceratobasidium sp. 395]